MQRQAGEMVLAPGLSGFSVETEQWGSDKHKIGVARATFCFEVKNLQDPSAMDEGGDTAKDKARPRKAPSITWMISRALQL